MAQSSSFASKFAPWLFGVLLFGILLFLYIIPAQTLGFWQPWETSFASLGRELATTDSSIFAPIINDEILYRPWLQLLLLKIGHGLGNGSEFGFRLPLILLNLTTAMFGFAVLSSLYGHKRAFLASLLFGISPVIFLSSLSLAGGAYAVAPITLTMIAAGWLVARPTRYVIPISAIMGGSLALSLWGGGLVGLGIALLSLALFAINEKIENQKIPKISWAIAAIFALLALLPVKTLLQNDWNSAKLGLAISIFVWVPLLIMTLAFPVSKARSLIAPKALIWIVVFVAMTISPFMMLYKGVLLPEIDGESTTRMQEALYFLLHNGFLTNNSLADHVTFDIALRYAGYAVYPMTFLVPLGYAYLYQTGQDDFKNTDDNEDGQRAFKHLMMIWAAVAFAVITISMSLAGQYIMPIAFPLVVPLALAATDRKFISWLRKNRSVYYAMGFMALMILAITSKDVKGTFDDDAGRPGPQVLFEFLTVDGGVEFPVDYAFERISFFFFLWAGIIMLMFANLRENMKRFAQTLIYTADNPSKIEFWAPFFTSKEGSKIGLFYRLIGKFVLRPLFWIGRWKGKTILKVLSKIKNGSARIKHSGITIGLLAFSVVAVGWTADLAFFDLPKLSHHFSQRGLLDSYQTIGNNAPLYTAGISEEDSSYYLTDDMLERIPRVANVANLFCENTQPVFVVFPADRLGEAYFHIRTHDNENCPNLGIHVVDSRSSRYILATNTIQEHNFVADNVFTRETIPESATFFDDEEITVDGKLRLVASEITPENLDSGPFVVTTYWEVLERVSGNYEMFIHVDQGGNRINGDHDPVNGQYSMRYWVPGEIVRDQFEMDVSHADKQGNYTVWLGFFRGDNRLEISPEQSDNRINVGQLSVRIDD